MTAQPRSHVRFKRAIERRALWAAEDAARELPNLPLEDALQLVYLYAERGSPKSTLAGAGLRVSEALALERRNVNVARGTLDVVQGKTDASSRTIDLTPALRDELAVWLDKSPFRLPNDRVFPTAAGRSDNRNNVRKRLLVKAIEKANVKLEELGIEPIGQVAPHGLRRTYASLRHAVGDDVAFTSEQLGHTDPAFTLRVYVSAARRRERLTEAERTEFDRAQERAQWAQTGTNGLHAMPVVAARENGEQRSSAVHAASD